jgi:chromatin assembly factor 1 subunit B
MTNLQIQLGKLVVHSLSLRFSDILCDRTRSPDGQCLILSARDGYCTLIIFDEILPAYHTQQHTLQLQSIAHHHSLPIWDSTSSSAIPHHSASNTGTPAVTPTVTSINLPFVSTPTVPKKRGGEPPLTPAASVDGGDQSYFSSASASATRRASQSGGEGEKEDARDKIQEPPKKKRRVALTKVGDLGS